MRLLSILLGCALAACAADQSDQDEVVAVVNKLFAGMSSKNVDQIASTMTADAKLFSAQNDKISLPLAGADFARRIAANKSAIVERMWNPTVLVRGSIAMLWADYDVYVDSKFGHCGIDAFMLLKTADGWKISQIEYTSETQNCKPSPLGVPDPGERRHP
jgi:ketosteroid isomerase-like protein